MMALKSFFRRISKDFHHKELMPLKIIFFVQTSTLYILYPYLTIHMRELGISVEETAIMSAITPFVAIIMPPVAGLIADRIGNFKILLSLFSALGGAAALLLLLVPIGRITVNLPPSVVLDVSCPLGSDGLVYGMSQEHPCDTLLEPHLDLTLQSCGYACAFDERNETTLRAMLDSRSYTLSVFNAKTMRNDTYAYSISPSDMPEAVRFADMDLKESRNLKNVEFYQIATRQLSRSVLFFPAHRPQLFGFACDSATGNASSVTCGFDSRLSQVKEDAEKEKFGASVKALKLSEEDSEEKRRRYLGRGVQWQGSSLERAAQCSGGGPDHQASVSLRLDDDDGSLQLRSDSCRPSCLLTAPRAQICSNTKMEIEYNIRLTFWTYLVIRVFIGMIGGTAFAMFEGAVIAILREQKADYGLQRIYGSIGGMISSPLSGLLIDYASGNRGYADFRPAFYLYATLKIFSGALMLMINLEFKAPASNVVSDVVSVLKNIEVVALLTACFVLGTAWGYIESFLFWFLEDLGASRTLMGITITVGGVAGIPLLVMSGPIISRIGHANVIFIGFVFYAIRLLGYSLIYNPWLCLIFEALESVTSSLSFTAAVTYAAKLSTTTTDTSIQGLLGGLYYGVGKGAGSLIGGFLMKAVGTRPTYQIFAAMTLLTGFMYLLFNMLYLARRPQVEGNDIVKKKPKDRPVQENGTAANLEDNKAKKEKMAQEVLSEPYIVEDIEAINNAKNLEIVEALDDASPDEQDLEKNDSNQMTLRHRATEQNGMVNPAFETEEVSVTDETKSSK